VDWQAVTAAGLYDPDAENAADRRALIEYLDGLGCTLDEMVAAHARGRLFGLAGDRIVRPGRDEFTLREAAAKIGAEPALVQRLWQAFGLPIVDVDTKVASASDLDALPLFLGVAALLGEDAALGLARVNGAAVARIADAVSAAFRSAISDLATDTSGSELVTAQTFAGVAALAPPAGRTLDVLLRHHLEAARQQFEVSGSGDVALSGQVRSAIGFADVSGFTALSQVATSAELSRLVDAFEELATTHVHEAGGRVVKFIGDAVMYVTPHAASAVDVALRLLHHSSHPVRAGVTYGLLLAQDGDYFGPPVNLAARLVAAAEPGQLLVDAEAATRLDETYQITPQPPATLRGIAEPVVAYAVEVASGSPPTT
jgi:class 3 adenylate cyclase